MARLSDTPPPRALRVRSLITSDRRHLGRLALPSAARRRLQRGNPLWFGLSCFTVLVTGISFLFAWLRLASNSVWPAVLLHASHNLWIQGVFDRLTTDTGPTEWWIGEFGAGLALVSIPVALVALYLRKRSPLQA